MSTLFHRNKMKQLKSMGKMVRWEKSQGSFDHVDFVTVVVNIQNSGWLQVSFYGNFDPDKSLDSTIPGK